LPIFSAPRRTGSLQPRSRRRSDRRVPEIRGSENLFEQRLVFESLGRGCRNQTNQHCTDCGGFAHGVILGCIFETEAHLHHNILRNSHITAPSSPPGAENRFWQPACFSNDLTDITHHELELSLLAWTDSLTGCLNRRGTGQNRNSGSALLGVFGHDLLVSMAAQPGNGGDLFTDPANGAF
jgi:hypothetical protein